MDGITRIDSIPFFRAVALLRNIEMHLKSKRVKSNQYHGKPQGRRTFPVEAEEINKQNIFKWKKVGYTGQFFVPSYQSHLSSSGFSKIFSLKKVTKGSIEKK